MRLVDRPVWPLLTAPLIAGSYVPVVADASVSIKRGDVLDAVGASADLQDAVARGLAGCHDISGDKLAAVLRQAGVPERLALRVEDRVVRAACGTLQGPVDV